MSRTKKQATPDIFDQAVAPQQTTAQEQPVTHTAEQPAQTLQSAMAETYPAPQTAPTKGQDAQPERSWQERTCVAIDTVAGVKLHFNHRNHTAIIEFMDGKPSDEVLAVLKTKTGFRWRFPDKDSMTWQKMIEFPIRAQDRAAAHATFNEVADLLRMEKSVGQAR